MCRGTLPSRLIKNEKSATGSEYGLIAAFISIACIMAFQMLGLNLADVFSTITNGMSV